jgi:hypothetical protein
MSRSETTSRCIARRAFAAEYDDATYRFSEQDAERAPAYLLLPTGQRANRLFVVGTLIDVETRGDGDWYRSRVADPTGSFEIIVGEEAPRPVRTTLRQVDPPAFVSVTGKTRRYEPENGPPNTNLRAEDITTTSQPTRDRWIVDTARRTADRLEQFDSANEYARMVRDQYDPELDQYRRAAREAVEEVRATESTA